MPEGPEVETVRRQLKKVLPGIKIRDIKVLYDNIIEGDTNEFIRELINDEFVDFERRGKHLIFILKNNVMLSHLRMEGKFIYISDFEQITKHDHVIFYLDNGYQLRYNDTRKFGRLQLRTHDNYLNTHPISNVAMEPHEINVDELYEKIKNKRIAIKQTLLDQSLVASLGNIYVDETLFLSKVHPTRKTNEVTKKELKAILKNASIVLEKATNLGGTTIRSFKSFHDMDGRFQNELNVHLNEGKPCPVCGTTIEKIKVGGRGTYVCNNCQK